jgi:hypothetical protein
MVRWAVRVPTADAEVLSELLRRNPGVIACRAQSVDISQELRKAAPEKRKFVRGRGYLLNDVKTFAPFCRQRLPLVPDFGMVGFKVVRAVLTASAIDPTFWMPSLTNFEPPARLWS